MTSALETVDSGLQVMTGAGHRADWSGALAEFFEIGRKLLRRVSTDMRSGRLASPAFLFGASGQHAAASGIDTLMRRVDAEYDIELVAPFEETESIAGALWSGRELFGEEHEDGLAKLRFEAGTLDLPLHAHEHSDRFIAVCGGRGMFWWSDATLSTFAGTNVHSVPVGTGDILVFTRGLLHTFSAPRESLTLLSYHSPEIAFDDARQYTIPAIRWTPREADLSHST